MVVRPSDEEGLLEEVTMQYWHLYSITEQENIFAFIKELVEARMELSGRFLLDTSEGLKSKTIQYYAMLFQNERKLLWDKTKHLVLIYHLDFISNKLND